LAPSPNSVTITVTAQADPSKRAQATLSVQQNGSVSLSPSTATLARNHRVTLTAQVIGVANAGVAWTVNGVAGGNATLGQICVTSVNPCQPVTNGTAAQVDYLAPGGIPSPNPVTVQATSAADPTKSANSQITVINHVVVTVLPASVTLAPLAVQAFSATVLGGADQTVVWQVQGSGCTSGAGCGVIHPSGTYTAPDAAPSPDSIQILAISSDDISQSGAANVLISTGANILALHPASVYAGAADGFTLHVDGSGFAATTPGPGSVVLIAGAARTAICNSTTECTVPITVADVAAAGNLSVQIQNPVGASSNGVSLVVAAPNVSDDRISLTSGAPAATGEDIVTVEPTTAGVSLPGDDLDLNLEALGPFSLLTSSCTLGGNPLALQRPASGNTTADICLFSESGLDTSMSFTVSGPGDITVIAKQPVGLGIVRITLQISSTALPGMRTLFVQNTNLDKAAASGALEVN
jgi:trimeric autotransporter adhesin